MAAKHREMILGVLMLLMVTVTLAPVFGQDQSLQTGEGALISTFERLEEWRTWEIRRELHRIHHHLEYMPIMVFTHVGVLIVLAGLLVLKIKESKKS